MKRHWPLPGWRQSRDPKPDVNHGRDLTIEKQGNEYAAVRIGPPPAPRTDWYKVETLEEALGNPDRNSTLWYVHWPR